MASRQQKIEEYIFLSLKRKEKKNWKNISV